MPEGAEPVEGDEPGVVEEVDGARDLPERRERGQIDRRDARDQQIARDALDPLEALERRVRVRERLGVAPGPARGLGTDRVEGGRGGTIVTGPG